MLKVRLLHDGTTHIVRGGGGSANYSFVDLDDGRRFVDTNIQFIYEPIITDFKIIAIVKRWKPAIYVR